MPERVPRWQARTLEGFERAFGEHGRDRTLLDFDLNALSDFHREIHLANIADAPSEPARDHDLIALGELFHRLTLFFLALHLRADEQEVEQRDHHHQRPEGLEQAWGLGSGCSGLGVGRANQEV